MLQLFNVARCLSLPLPFRVIPRNTNGCFRCMSHKCKKDGGNQKSAKDNTGSKCQNKEKSPKPDENKCSPKKEEKPKCKCDPCKCDLCPMHPKTDHANCWKKIVLMGALPIVAILTLLVFTGHEEKERPEFKPWPHLYRRTKRFYFGDGNRTYFHNPHWNPLPPDGYEDETDTEARGKPAETDEERDKRLKGFQSVQKDWKKFNDKREAAAKKAAAEAEKEAKKQQELAEKEAKKAQDLAEKEEKKRKAEEEKELKRQKAEEEKEEKRLKAEEAAELKRREAEDKKAAAQKVEHATASPYFESSED